MPGSSWTQTELAETQWAQNSPAYPGQDQTVLAAPMGMGAQVLQSYFELAESTWTEGTVPSGTITEGTVTASAWQETEL